MLPFSGLSLLITDTMIVIANYILYLFIILTILIATDVLPALLQERKTIVSEKTRIVRGNWQLDDNWEMKLEK